MEKIENATVLIIERTDFIDYKRRGDITNLPESVLAAVDTSDIVIYAGEVFKNRYFNEIQGGLIMDLFNTRLRMEDNELLVRALGEMLRAVSCHCDKIEDTELSSILFIASYAASDISKKIEALTEEIRKADK